MAEDTGYEGTADTGATAGDAFRDGGMTETEASMRASSVNGGSVTDGERSAGDGNFWDSFNDESLKNNPSVRKHANAEALAKSYVELSRKLGQRGDIPLPKDATPEQIEARRALHRGENIKSVEDYSWKLSAADARDMNEETYAGVKTLGQRLFDAGLDNETYASAMDTIVADVRNAKAQQLKEIAENEAALRDEWNEDYDINMRANKIFVEKNFPEIHKWAMKTNAYSFKEFAMMIHRINEMTADGQIRLERAAEKSFEDRMSELTKSDAYRQNWHPDHDKAIAARTKMIMERAERQRR